MVAALATFIVVGDPAAGVDDAADWKWAVSSVVVVILAGVVMVFGRGARPARRAAALGTVAGMLFGMSASLAKPVVEELDDSGFVAILEDWRTWALVIMGVVAFLIQQGALATGQLAPAVATTSLHHWAGPALTCCDAEKSGRPNIRCATATPRKAPATCAIT